MVNLPERAEPFFLRGNVVDLDGTGIANARVQCDFVQGGGGSSGVQTFTDQRGRFELEWSLPLDAFETIRLTARTVLGRTGIATEIPATEVTSAGPVEIVVGAGESISGRVATQDGTPLAQAALMLEQDGFEPYPKMERRKARTDEKGQFRFSALQSDRTYRLSVEAEGWARERLEGLEVGVVEQITLVPEAVIRGRVVDLDGNPVVPSSISLTEYVGNSSRGYGFKAQIDNGGFVVPGLRPGEYAVAANGEPRQDRIPRTRWSERIRLAAGEVVDDVELVMLPLVAIRGVIVDRESRRPVAGATIADWKLDATRFPRDRVRTTSDRDGRFSLEGFTAGTHRLHIAGERHLKREQLVAVRGETDEEIIVELDAARELIVEVRDAHGQPVTDAQVRPLWEFPRRSVTDSRGIARVLAPARGIDGFKKDSRVPRLRRNRVAVARAGFAPVEITLTAEHFKDGRVAVTLSQSGTVSGRVLDHEGAPVAGVVVIARPEHGGGRGSGAGENGEYVIRGLLPGVYELSTESEAVPMPSFTRKVTVLAGEDTRADFSIPDPATFQLHGVRVVATFEDGRPAGAAAIQCTGGWRGEKHQHVKPLAHSANPQLKTGADGVVMLYFEAPGLDGIYLSGSFERDGEAYRLAGNAIEIVDGRTVVAVYAREPRGSVTVEVVDAASGKAITGYRYFFKVKRGGSGSRCYSPDGRITRKVRAGDVTVVVEARGYGNAEQALVLEDGGEESVRFRLDRDRSE